MSSDEIDLEGEASALRSSPASSDLQLVAITWEGLFSGCISIYIFEFIYAVIGVVSIPLLLIGFHNIRESIYSGLLTLSKTLPNEAVNDRQLLREGILICLIPILFIVGPMQFSFWGAKSFIRRRPIGILAFTISCIGWDVILGYTYSNSELITQAALAIGWAAVQTHRGIANYFGVKPIVGRDSSEQ